MSELFSWGPWAWVALAWGAAFYHLRRLSALFAAAR